MYFLIDPFNYFDISNFVDDKIKIKTLNKERTRINERALWKLLEHKRFNCENLLIGDSRIAALDTNEIKKVSGDFYYNYGIAGLDIESICDIFWKANSETKLKNVCIGLSFYYFRKDYNRQTYKVISSYENNMLKYITSRWVMKCLFENVSLKYNTISESENTKLLSDSTRFYKTWNEMIIIQDKVFKSYEINNKYYADLQKVIDYSNQHGINLIFIVFPEYKDIHNSISINDLEKTNLEFYDYFHSKAKVFNFNNDANLYSNKKNFDDPLHPNQNINKLIINEVWGNN